MRKVKRYSVWADELFGEKLAINSKNGMVHLVVKFDDYAALEAKCAELAEENARLKSAVTQQIELRAEIKKAGMPPHADFWVQSICEAEENVKRAIEETPATNAFLAEIERKAISNFISSIEHILRDKLSPYGADEMLESRRIFLKEQGGAKK